MLRFFDDHSELILRYFPLQFSVEFDRRAAGKNLDRMSVINLFANAIKQPPHKVNLTNPTKTIMVNIVKSTCGVSVVDNFRELGRYNLRALAGQGEAGVDEEPKEKKETTEKAEEEKNKE